MRRSGIYRITNRSNGKTYVGASTHVDDRWRHHRYALRHGHHGNPHLQRAWLKYGEESFDFVLLEELPRDKVLLQEREVYWISQLKAEYNIQDPRLIYTGYVPDDARRKKLSTALRGRPKSLAHRVHLKAATARYYATHRGPNLGRKFSLDFRRKVSEAAKLRVPYTRTEEHRRAAGEKVSAYLAEHPRPLKPSTPCGHCSRVGGKRRHGLCGACSEYKRRHGVNRPLEKPPALCSTCQVEGVKLKLGRCGACYVYFRRHGVERFTGR